MIYDKSRHLFIFENKAEVKPNALLFYDLPHLLSIDEEPCSEVALLAQKLPHVTNTLTVPEKCHQGAKSHQIEPIDWVVARDMTGIVAYGMGLGKTFIGIRSCIAYKRKRVLVVCPAHLKRNWYKEITKWGFGATCHICEGRNSDMSDTAVFTIINRDILNNNLDKLLTQGFDQIMVDECHKCGNWGTGAYKALDKLCKAVRKNKGGILLLTGTLFKNTPMDAHTALHLLDPHIPGPRSRFQARFDPIGKRREEVLGWQRRKSAPRWLIGKKWAEIKALEKERGKNGDVEALRWLLQQYAIRKRYCDVFPDDGKTRHTDFRAVDLTLTAHQREILGKGAMMDGDKINSDLVTVLRLVAEQKAPFVADYAESWLEEHEEEKLVIATWHIKAREIIKKELEKYGVVEIKGTPKQKDKAETKFREDPDTRVCLLNLESGGTGLNLVSASTFIFSEVPWTGASYDQLKARIDRIGQEADSINYVVFLAADTPEGAKFGTLKKKSGLNDRYM